MSFRPNNPSTSSIMLSHILGLNTRGSNGRPTGTGPDDLRPWWIRGNQCFPIPWEDALSEHHRFPIDVPHVLFSADSAISSLWFYSIAKQSITHKVKMSEVCCNCFIVCSAIPLRVLRPAGQYLIGGDHQRFLTGCLACTGNWNAPAKSQQIHHFLARLRL